MDPSTRRDANIERLREVGLDRPGTTSPETRAAAAHGGPLPDDLAA